MVMLSELLQGIIAAAIVALIVSLCCFFYWRKIRKEKQQRHVNFDLNTVESQSSASEEQKGKHQHRGDKPEDVKWHQQERRRKLEQILQDHALREGHTIGPRLGDYKEVDLHSYTLKEAMEVVELYLAVSLDDYQEAEVVQKRYVDVITGRGKHSKDGIPVIKLAVSEYLVAQGYM
ncbi:hypothetical protein BsWGS_11004 [Bradybaena similaris]